MPARAVGEQVDADQLRARGLGGADGELERPGRRVDRNASAAERDVRSPLSGGSDPGDRADGDAAGDHHAQIEPRGRDELLHHRSVPLEPEPTLERVEVATQCDLVLAQLDLPDPSCRSGA